MLDALFIRNCEYFLKNKTPKYINTCNHNYIMNIYYYFLNLNQTSILKLLFCFSFFTLFLSFSRSICSYFFFLIWTPFVFPEIGTPSLVHVIDGSGLADRTRHRNCNFLPTLTFLALIFFNSGFLPENEGKKF